MVRDVPSPRQGNESWHLSVLLPLSTHSLSLSSPLLLAAAPSPGYEMVGPERREEEEGREKEQRGGGIEAKDFKRRKGERRQGKGKEALLDAWQGSTLHF